MSNYHTLAEYAVFVDDANEMAAASGLGPHGPGVSEKTTHTEVSHGHSEFLSALLHTIHNETISLRSHLDRSREEMLHHFAEGFFHNAAHLYEHLCNNDSEKVGAFLAAFVQDCRRVRTLTAAKGLSDDSPISPEMMGELWPASATHA